MDDPFDLGDGLVMASQLHNMTNASGDALNVTITTTSSPGFVDNFAELRRTMFTVQYVLLPVFLITGLLGNVLTILTMVSSRFQHMTSRYILIFLAISDTLLLITQPFNKLWVMKLFGRDLRALSRVSCKLFFILFKSAKMTSSWLVVLLAFERFVAVVFPMKAKQIIRKRFILPAIALDYIVMLTYNSVWHFSSDVVNGMCKPDMPSTKHKIFVTIGTTFYSFIPTALLMIFTPQIIVRLIRQQKFRQRMSHRGLKHTTSTSSRSKQDIEMFRASVMVLGVMIAYVILIIPITTVHLYAFTAGVSAFDANVSKGFFIYREIAQTLEQINYAVNFFFYVLCSFTFRQRVKEILCFTACRKSNPLERQLTRTSAKSVSRQRSDIDSTD